MPFLIGAGQLSDSEMTFGSTALKAFWGGEVIECDTSDSPNSFLSSFPKKNTLCQLIGDPAIVKSEDGSWLECLGAWKIPVILLVSPSSQGEIPGTASAYVALCKELLVPLIGVVQLGGEWDQKLRSLDGLPWCGRLPADQIQDSNYMIESSFVVQNLMKRMPNLNL